MRIHGFTPFTVGSLLVLAWNNAADLYQEYDQFLTLLNHQALSRTATDASIIQLGCTTRRG
jgi:hypothetical protein